MVVVFVLILFVLKGGKVTQLLYNRFDVSIENLHAVRGDFPIAPVLRSFQTRKLRENGCVSPRLPQKLEQG